MKGMDRAVQRISKAVSDREPILIHGDYDVDGITASALMARTLERLGAPFATFLPERTVDGYGVSPRAITKAREEGARLIITADCGITAHAPLALAASLGIEVIVIDHHRIPPEGLPEAYAILNPLQEDCGYPFKELSAAGLVFKLSQALVGDSAFEFLDLAALSTISDVAPLVEENRILVKKGLERLSLRTNPGLSALGEVAGLKARQITVAHVGFVLAPRLNAAGRMSTPDMALRLLLANSAAETASLAAALDEENKLRQKEERQVTEQAIRQIERTVNFNRERVLVAVSEGWHPGVIGIVASRLVDRFHRPAIVIALHEGRGKGSGRSIKNFHLFEAMESCRDLFENFGGHAQAAGLQMSGENVALLRERINRFAQEKYPAEIFIKTFPVDLEIRLEDLRQPFIGELQLLEPHGAGNPKPSFLTRGLEVRAKPEKLTGETVKFWVTDGLFTAEALWTPRAASDAAFKPERGMRLDLIYSVKTRVWDGRETISLDVKSAKQV